MKTMLTGAVCALALTTTLAAALPARAQTAAPEAGAVTLIQAGRLLDHPGRAPRGPSTLVVRDGKVVEIRDGFVGEGNVVDLRSAFVLPGLIDSHTHGLWGACRDLFEVFPGLGAPLSAVLDGVVTRAAKVPLGTWIIAGPWRPIDRPSFGPRPAEMLDRIAPNHPVAIKDVSQHNLWLNSTALRRAGITRDTPDPVGGVIERDATGAPTGILIEAAGALVQGLLEPSAAQLDQAVAHLSAVFHGLGITGFKEPMAFEPELAAYAKADAPGVYVDDAKIASLGLRVRKGCTFHGLALNVNMDLSPFSRINPCGYAGMQMIQTKDIAGPQSVDEAKQALQSQFVAQLAVSQTEHKTGLSE